MLSLLTAMTEWFGVDQVIALIIFIVAGVGMSCNWFVVAFISKVPTLQNAFGRLTTSQALAEAIHLSIFALLVAPMIFFEVEAMREVSRFFGQALLICYDVCVYSHFIISLNRMAAVMLPFQYDRLFSIENTRKIVFSIWTLAIISSIYLYGMNDCELHYVTDFWNFTFSTTPVCGVIAWYTDFMKSGVIVIIIVCIDMFTLIRVHSLNVSVLRSTSTGPNQRCRKADEVNFLKQTCLQGALFVWELLTYFILYQYFESRYIQFFFTTFAWISVHSADGFITLIFNRDFHQIWKKGVRNMKIDAKTLTFARNSLKTQHDLANSRDDTSTRIQLALRR